MNCTFRKATPADLPVVYKMQNIPFRENVYANFLPDCNTFCEQFARKMESGEEVFYLLEQDGETVGFAEIIRTPDHNDIIVWGKWLKTLMYASMKAAFDQLGCAKVNSAVRRDNKRVMKTYEDYNIRKIGQEMIPYRKGSALGFITIAYFNYYEMTLEEFREKEAELRRQSLEVVFA